MKTLSRCALVLVALALGACGNRSPDGGDAGAGIDAEDGSTPFSDPVSPDAEGGAGGPFFDPDLPDTVGTAGQVDDPDDLSGVDPIFSPGTDPIDDADPPGLDPIFDPDSASLDPDDTIDAGPAIDPDDPEVDTSPDPDDMAGTPIDEAPDEDAVAAPAFPGRPNAASLYAGLTRIVGATLLDLDARLSGGMELTDQQLECLGDHDAALGESALAIDCGQPLAIESLAVSIERGAFAPTDTCLASVAGGTIDGCVLTLADARVPIVFVARPAPERNAEPVAGSGFLVGYDVDLGVFEISREPEAPIADYRCGIDVATGTTLPTNRGDCDGAFRDAALHVESLLAPS